MKIKSILYISISLVMAACGGRADDGLDHHDHAHGHSHSHEGHSHEGHDHEGEEHEAGEIVLEPESAEQFGLTTIEVAPSEFRQSIAVSGQIVDAPGSMSVVTAPTAGTVNYARGITLGSEVRQGSVVATISAQGISGGDANASAKAALDAAKRELDRLEPLYKERLVTAKTYNDALQAYEQARAAYSPKAASGSATAVQAGVITELLVPQGQYVEAGEPIAAISSSKELTLRADLPEKYYREAAAITSALIELPYSHEIVDLASLQGRRVASAQAGSSTRGYMPVYFTFANDGSVLPGTYVKAHLLGGTRSDVISLPKQALSEQQGQYFVYEQLDEECYRKLPVTIGATDGVNVEILQGIEPGQHIVATGVVAVRLAESSAVAPEGHTHNH